MGKNHKLYIIASIDEFTDGTGILSDPNGEFGEEGWVELKNQHSVILETEWYAEDRFQAIQTAAEKWGVSPEVLTAYERMPSPPSKVLKTIKNNALVKVIEVKENTTYAIIDKEDPDTIRLDADGGMGGTYTCYINRDDLISLADELKFNGN
jgi:hypothetical protein